MILNILLIIAGIALLVAGAEGLVRGSASIASKLRISPLVIGLTIVSFGTSAPELTVNLIAAFNGSSDIAVGNVIGSNITNILLILGVSACIVPLTVKSSTVWKEIPLAFLGVLLILIMGNDQFFDGIANNALTRTDGIALLSLMIIFMYYVFGMAKKDREKEQHDSSADKVEQYTIPTSIIVTTLGMTGLVVGGRLLVSNATSIATTMGLSDAFIGLTVVAIGTSLPELATSIVAALRGHADIAIGNVVGSNIFNTFFVLGTTSTVLALPINVELNIDIMLAVAATALLFIFMFVFGRRQLARYEGVLLLIAYVAYNIFVIMRG